MSESDKKDPQIRESLVTYEMYANMPDDGLRYEVDDGTLELMSPGPAPTHQMLSFAMQRLINDSCGQDYIVLNAPVDVILSDIEVRQPDLVLIHRNRMSIVKKRGIFGAPDLVVEISSEHSLRRDRVRKTKAYAKYGVPEYWIVDMGNSALEQYILDGDKYELVELYCGEDPVLSERLPCVTFTMNDLTRDLPELMD
jgi:Uma2 family endonuclease